MTARAAIAAVLLLIGSRAAGVAHAANGCADLRTDAATGPLMGGAGPADFGAVPEACGATDVMLRARGALLIASTMPDYYGRIFAGATARGRLALDERTTLSLAADLIDYRYVNNGGLASHDVSAGPGTVALQRAFFVGDATVLAAHARALVPLDTARRGGLETGLELGGSFRARAGARWILDGGVALTAPLAIVGGQAHLRFEPVALAEAWLRVRPSVALCGGVNARLDVAPTFELGTLVPRLGARFLVNRRWWSAVLVELPVAGADRTDVIAGLYAGFTPD